MPVIFKNRIISCLAVLALIFSFSPNLARAQDAITKKNVKVILINFSNYSDSTWTPQELNSQLFGGSDSLSAYYKESSYGKLEVTGKVFGQYTLPVAQTCQPTQVFNEAVKAAHNDPGYTDNTSDPVVVVAPFGPGDCGWLGYSAGYSHLIAITTSAPNLKRAVTHELGHDLGIMHASSLECGGAGWAATGCVPNEYGDVYDVMGASVDGMGQFNAVHKEFAGWFDPGNIQTVTQSGRFTIEPLETSNSNPKVLKIPHSAGEYLYVEYRQPIGFDATLPADVFQGALLHIATSNSPRSNLITPMANSGSPVLTVGNSFLDSSNNTRIKVVSGTPQGLVIDVAIGNASNARQISVKGKKLPVSFATASLVNDQGVVYFIQGRSKIPFTNLQSFLNLGYSLKNVIAGDTSQYALGSEFVANDQIPHPAGSWVLYGKTVYYSAKEGLVPVPSWQVFLQNGGRPQMLVKANIYDLQLLNNRPVSVYLTRGDGRIL